MTAAPWFKPKRYGYGAEPSSWQGWAATGVYALFCVATGLAVEFGWIPLPLWLLILLAATAVFTWVARAKTSSRWRWRWGREEEG